MHKTKGLFVVLIASSFFLCQGVHADSSDPISETNASQMMENPATVESSEASVNENDPSSLTRWEKLEQRRKEVEETLDQAKKQLIEKREKIDQTVSDLENQAMSDRKRLAEKLAEDREKAEAVRQQIEGATQRATEVQEEFDELETATATSLNQTKAQIQSAKAEIHEKTTEAQAAMADFETRKADLSASIQRIKSTLRSAGKQSVQAGTVNETKSKEVEKQEATMLPKTSDTLSNELTILGVVCLVMASVVFFHSRRGSDKRM